MRTPKTLARPALEFFAGARRHTWLALSLVFIALACSSKQSAPPPPAVTPVGTLAPRGAEASEQAKLAVAHAAPRGEAPLDARVHVLFNEALRPLGSADATPAPALVLEPSVPGEWRWMGAAALTFVPRAGRLPAATAYRVRVPAGLRGLDGDVLASDYELVFETPEPALLRSTPESGTVGLAPDARLELVFNQPVAASELARAGRLLVLRGQRAESLPFDVRARPSGAELEVVPRRPLPLAARLEFRLSRGLRGREGPRPLAADQSVRFETYGPLRVVGVNCNVSRESGGCDPDGSLWVELSNPVKVADFRAAVSVTPELPLRWPDDAEGESRYHYLPLAASLAPATAYTVSLAAGLPDSHGQRLAAPASRVLTTGNYRPRVRLPISGEIFPAPFDALAIEARNVPELRVYTRRLDGAELLEYFAVANDYTERSKLPERLRASELRIAGLLDNRSHHHPLALGAALGASGRGAAWVGWRAGELGDGQLVQVTDLALTAKLSASGSLVWVTRLGDGKPIAGATVELSGGTPALAKSYMTNAEGLVSIPAADFRPRLREYGSEEDAILSARLGGDVVSRRVADFVPPWRIEPAMRLELPERSYALLFSDRGIYRPGDTLKLKGVLRREVTTGNAVIARQKLALTLEDELGEVAEKQTVESNERGTFAADVHIPFSAALGRWRVVAEGFADDALAFDIAEYRPAEFQVRAEALAAAYMQRDTAAFRVRADYLFGAPMAGAKLTYTASRERTSYAPPSSTGYVTSDDAYRADLDNAPLDAAVVARGTAELGPTGSFDLPLPLTLPGQTGPERVRLDAEVSDLSRQAIAASTGVLVHPASHYVGIGELESWFQSVGTRIAPRVLAWSPDGARLAGRRVKLELVRRRWTIAREQTSDGWRTRSQPVDEVQGSCEVVSAKEPASCGLDIVESGQLLLRATSRDPEGRETHTSLSFYGLGAGRPSWPDNDQRKLELALDKPAYRVGDTARLLIKSPFERAEALLTVERAGIYEHRRLTLQGPTPTVDIAVDERLRPNAYVAVHLVQGVLPSVTPTPLESTPEPGYRLGYAALRVDPEAQRLAVALSGIEAEYRPGQKVSLDVRVTDGRGAPHAAELTVYAVDEGVLALTGHAAPDPLAVFTAPRPLGVATVETREALGRLVLLGPERDKGHAGGGGGALGSRRDFRSVAHFDPTVLTDAQGKAHVEFSLPDNLTTYRLMAVAVSEDDHYGVGSGALVVNRPLMLRPALPRRLRAGDALEASAIVNVRGAASGRVVVRAEVRGGKLRGPSEREIELGPSGSAEARFGVDVADAGELEVTFEARLGKEADRVQVKRPVAAPLALEAMAVYGRTEGSEGQALASLDGLRADVGGLELRLASTALVGLDAGLTQLLDYPYACTEQLASRVLPLAPLSGLARRYEVALPAELPAVLEANVGEILKRQRGDGGFALWPSSPEPHPWVSAYTLWVLKHARDAGARVPARTFDQGVSYLRQVLGGFDARPEHLPSAALIVDVLAALGHPDDQYVARLFARRSELPPFAQALLLHAAQSGGRDPSVVSGLRSALEGRVSVQGNRAQLELGPAEARPDLFDSEARTEALVLWALLAVEPRHALAEPLARGVLERRQAGRWRSTQEAAYALLALDAYRNAQEPEAPRFEASVWLGQERLMLAAFEGGGVEAASVTRPMSGLGQSAGPLVFEKRGAGTLFYEARLRYARTALPDAPLDRGFALQRGVRVVRPETLAPALDTLPDLSSSDATVAGGDLVLVDLVVAAPARRHFVVIEDPLPAGLEAVDAALATTSRELDVGARPPPTLGFQTSWFRQELRDDRALFFVDEMPAGLYHYRYLARATTLGRFVVPPARAEEMYQPELFGRTRASRFEVR